VSKVESLYQKSVAAMTPREKIARAIGLLNWSREIIGREVRKSNPTASTERLRLLVALRVYGGDAKMRSLIEVLLANVPD
jgi:hypothetical protein